MPPNLTLPLIDDLYTRRRTVKDTATALNLKPNQLSRFLRENSFKIPPSEKVATRAQNSADRQARTQALQTAAQEVNARTQTLQQAAQKANCHPRTLKRHGAC